MAKKENVTMDWGDNINSILHIKKINQKELAEITGFSPATICRYLKGERIPSVEFAKSLFEKLDIDPRWLFTEEPKKEIPRMESKIK